MPKLIKNGAVVTDNWTFMEEVSSIDELNGENLIIPATFWLENIESLADRAGSDQAKIAIWISGEDDIEPLKEHISQFALIAINFPAFMDGRGFSTARLLRDRYQFEGELRATGGFIRDQLAYLKRCGFNAFSLSDDIDVDGALQSLEDFNEYYQASTDQPLPLFRRRPQP